MPYMGNEMDNTYLSFSENKYRVISYGMPLSKDMDTKQAALAAVPSFNNGKLVVSDMAWHGHRGVFIPIGEI